MKPRSDGQWRVQINTMCVLCEGNIWMSRWPKKKEKNVKIKEDFSIYLFFKDEGWHLPLEMIPVDVGSDHFHAAGVDEALDAALHAGFDHVLRSWENGKNRNKIILNTSNSALDKKGWSLKICTQTQNKHYAAYWNGWWLPVILMKCLGSTCVFPPTKSGPYLKKGNMHRKETRKTISGNIKPLLAAIKL